MSESSSSRSRSSLKEWSAVAGCGILMGMADIIPGISGGTIAFLLGFYERLLESIKSLNAKAAWALVSLQFRSFLNIVEWKFLLPLLCGMAFSLVTLAHFFHYALGHEIYRIWLYAFFFGLIIAASALCIRRIKTWNLPKGCICLIGILIAYFFTDPHLKLNVLDSILGSAGGAINWQIAGCGAVAVCAMLLPGISGSYLLTVMGVYPTIIGALVDFTTSLKSFHLDVNALYLLLSMGMGIFLGALLFSRGIGWLLKRHHDAVVAFLSGCMIGALRAIWPFYTYVPHSLNMDKGFSLYPESPYFPSMDSPLFFEGLALMLAGMALIFLLDFLAKKRFLTALNH